MFVRFVCDKSRDVYKNGQLLRYETVGSSGMDLRAVSITEFSTGNRVNLGGNHESCQTHLSDKVEGSVGSYVLHPSERVLIHCGISMAIDKGLEVQIRSRSGLSWKHGVIVLNAPGTIDSDYRGEIGAIMINTSNKPYEILFGERIAQMVVCPVHIASVFVTEELPSSERDSDGFGSTGRR